MTRRYKAVSCLNLEWLYFESCLYPTEPRLTDEHSFFGDTICEFLGVYDSEGCPLYEGDIILFETGCRMSAQTVKLNPSIVDGCVNKYCGNRHDSRRQYE